MFYRIFPNMVKKTEKLYFSYTKLNTNEWINAAAKLTGLDQNSFGIYVVTTA